MGRRMRQSERGCITWADAVAAVDVAAKVPRMELIYFFPIRFNSEYYRSSSFAKFNEMMS